jgi:hypothetical protein
VSGLCETGCTYRGRHETSCACTTDCTEHPGHCKGCLPRRADVGRLCQRCYDDTLTALRAIPDLAAAAAARTDGRLNLPKRPTADGIHAVNADPASPSPAWDTADDAITWAWTWAEAAADHLTHAGPLQYTTIGLPARVLTACCTYLAAHLERLAAWEPAADFAAEARTLAHRLERVSGRDELTHRVKTPCPSCDRRTLIREDGSGAVMCRNKACGRIWHDGELEWMAHVAVS